MNLDQLICIHNHKLSSILLTYWLFCSVFKDQCFLLSFCAKIQYTRFASSCQLGTIRYIFSLFCYEISLAYLSTKNNIAYKNNKCNRQIEKSSIFFFSYYT